MPGIAGIISSHWSDQSTAQLSVMHARMTRESFDHSDWYCAPSLGLGVAWVNHRGSFANDLPTWNASRDIGLIFSGEDFSGADRATALKSQGDDDHPASAAHIIHLYEKHGADFAVRLNGSFAGVLVDLQQKKAFVFNDRYGLSRIYFHQTRDHLYFSSEAKTLLAILPALRQIDHRSLGEWFSCGCALQNRTLFRDVALLPGGSLWTGQPGQELRKATYFQPSTWTNQPELGAEDYYEQLHALFPRVLQRYLKANQPIAMSLTGGLDGRMVMAWADRGPGELPCYTFNGPYHDCADLRLGRRIAAACRQPHHTIPLEADFFQKFPDLAAKTILISDGAMDVTGAVELHANVRAREIAPIRLTGNYGSEILRTNVAFGPDRLHAPLFSRDAGNWLARAEETYESELAGNPLSFIAFKQVPWHHHSRLAVEQSQLTMRSPFLDNDLVQLVFRAPEYMRTVGEPSFRIIAAGRPDLARIPTDRGVTYPPVPFLTPVRRRYCDFMTKVEYAFDYGMPQSFAANVGRFLPRWGERFFLGNQKFYHFKTWYRHELAPYVQDILLDSRTLARPWYDPAVIRQMVAQHIAGSRNYTSEIHKLLSLELLQRQLLD